MTKVLDGVRVLEIAEYAMAPSAAAVLSDWGADVIKVEHPLRGDPIRGTTAWGVPPGGPGEFTYLWEPFNRGKRSVGIDISKPEGRELVLALARQADVFITNFLPATRRKLGIDVDDIRAANPKIVYGRGSAQGPRGAEANRGGFDGLTYWQRSGAGSAAMVAGSRDLVTLPAPAFGDSQTGMAFAGGLAAALYHRERTGEPSVVDISLLSSGMWAMQATLVGANVSGQRELMHSSHDTAPSPLSNYYATSDGRFVALSMLQGDRYWGRLCELMGRPDLAADPRFADIGARARNNVACIREMDAIFATRTLAEWTQILSQQDGQWSVVQLVGDLNDDPQAWANGYIQEVDYGGGRSLRLVSAPVQFDETPPELRPAPELGEHTEQVLADELGLDWDRIITLKDAGVVP